MNDLRAELAKVINRFSSADGVNESVVPSIRCIKFSRPNSSAKQHWRASLGIVAQGSKEIALDHEVCRYSEAHYIFTPLDLPVASRISAASPERPFLCLVIDFDSLILSEMDAQLEINYPPESAPPLCAVFTRKASDEMLAAACRLGKIFEQPEDAPVLGPLVIKEIFYHLLKGADGAAIRQFVRTGSKTHKISQAVYKMQSALAEEIDVASLAKDAGINRSDYFKLFKEVTAMSPIQYQKRFRLLEARRLMIETGETAESAAFKVGYKSPSQFSREYSRMFGNAPLRDTVKVKKTPIPSGKINL